MTPPRFSAAEGVYVLMLAEKDITLTLTHVARSKDGLTGTLRVETGSGVVRTSGGVVKLGKINLMAPRTVEEWTKALNRAFDTLDNDASLPWTLWFTELAVKVDKALTFGKPPILMSEQPVPGAVSTTRLGDLVVLNTLPMLICGDGEVGKSTLAAWMSGHLVAMGHRVLYIDFEEGPDDFADKLHRLFPGIVPEVYYHYAKPYGAIWDQREALVQQVALLGVTYVMIDSVAAAIAGSDGGPESAGNVTRYFGEVAALAPHPLGSCHLAHVTKGVRDDEQKNQKRPSPFGSVFWQNFVRLAYFADTDDEGTSSTRTVALYRTKINRLAKTRVPHLALSFTYDDTVENGTITVAPAALLDNPTLAQRLSYTQRVAAALAKQTMTTSEIAIHLYGSDDEENITRARVMLNKLQQQSRVVNLNPGTGGRGIEARWGLLSRRDEKKPN